MLLQVSPLRLSLTKRRFRRPSCEHLCYTLNYASLASARPSMSTLPKTRLNRTCSAINDAISVLPTKLEACPKQLTDIGPKLR